MKADYSQQKIPAVVLRPAVKNYHWGKVGKESLAARLLTNFDPELCYAEIWYGSHPKGPSILRDSKTQRELPTLVAEKPHELLGETILGQYGATLPFLTKIISIEKALSIQAHPDIQSAKLLHSKDPKNYPDSNHKPEIAIALSNVSLLHGWISKGELQDLLKDFVVLNNFLNKHKIDSTTWSELSRKELVNILHKSTPPEIAGLNNLILKTLISISNPSPKQQLYIELTKQFALDDAGLLLSLFLRLLSLNPGEAVYTQPGEIHAYLSGELLECMANSDNVIRAGLTPKFQDVVALIEFANFAEGSTQPSLPKTEISSAPFQKYFSAASEFEVYSIVKGNESFKYSKSTTYPELLLLFEGAAKITVDSSSFVLQAGEAILICAESTEISIELEAASIARICMPN